MIIHKAVISKKTGHFKVFKISDIGLLSFTAKVHNIYFVWPLLVFAYQ